MDSGGMDPNWRPDPVKLARQGVFDKAAIQAIANEIYELGVHHREADEKALELLKGLARQGFYVASR